MYSIELQDLGWILTLDIVVLIACLLFVLRQFHLSFAHPYFFYLFYHVYSVTYRLYAVLVGQPTMYEMEVVSGRLPISYDELMRAAIWHDVALLLFTLSAVYAERIYNKKRNARVSRNRKLLNNRIATFVCLACLMVGMPIFAIVRGQTEVGLGTFGQTGYAGFMSNWPLVSILSLIYLYGFRAYLVVPGVLFLAVNALQGYHRVMTVIPILFVLLVYLERKNRNWPNATFIMLLLALFALFPVLKYIGRAYRLGDIQTAKQLVAESAKNSLMLSAEYAPNFLDQFACALTLADDLGKKYYGKPYAYMTVYWIPRTLWPEKPVINEFMFDMATPQRPIAVEGRIVTYLGDGYINFGSIGMILYPAVISFCLTLWYAHARHAEYFSIIKYLYIVFAVGFLQVYRDGLVSMVMFSLVHNMPALLVLVVHAFYGNTKVPNANMFVKKQLSMKAWNVSE